MISFLVTSNFTTHCFNSTINKQRKLQYQNTQIKIIAPSFPTNLSTNSHLQIFSNMRGKPQYPFNLKTILICFFFLLFFFLILRSSFPYSQPISLSPPAIRASNSSDSHQEENPTSCLSLSNSPPTCTKISPSLAHTILHYATLNITPQQTLKEISVSLKVLERKSPCNFLVFGLGHDSLMWTALNHNGRTVFLEEDKEWIAKIKEKIPSLEAYHVAYDTKVTQADELLEVSSREECRVVTDPRFSKCPLSITGFPGSVYDVEWDLIMVDAPTGYFEGAPGRMSAIYTAGLMARNREDGETDVFVHDVDRVVEDKFSKALLCEGYLVEQEGRIRHFNIPSHRTTSGRSFCP